MRINIKYRQCTAAKTENKYLVRVIDLFFIVVVVLRSSLSGLRGNCQLTTPVSSCLRTKDWTSSVMVSWEPHTHILVQAHSLDLSLSQTITAWVSEEESEEDEADILTREALKRQSQLIVDSNSKKKPWKKKKDKF